MEQVSSKCLMNDSLNEGLKTITQGKGETKCQVSSSPLLSYYIYHGLPCLQVWPAGRPHGHPLPL